MPSNFSFLGESMKKSILIRVVTECAKQYRDEL